MAGNDPPAVLLPSDIPSSAEKSQNACIEEMSAALQSLGVPACVFEIGTYLRRGYFPNMFANLLRPLKNYNDDAGKLERALKIGIRHHHFESYRSASADQFYNFLNFLRTPAGQTALSQIAKYDRLARRGGEHFTAQEMAWIDMFEAQRDDLARRLDDIRRDHRAVIEDLKLQLCRARHQLETDSTRIKRKFSPAGLYVPLDEAAFNRACRTEYTLECHRQKQVPVELSESFFDYAALKFGDRVKKRHVLEYLDVGHRKQKLQDYIDRRRRAKA